METTYFVDLERKNNDVHVIKSKYLTPLHMTHRETHFYFFKRGQKKELLTFDINNKDIPVMK